MSNKLSNNTFKKKTGIQNIQVFLESGRSITALEALSNFGIFRLASAIEVLRKRGMNIETETKQDPNGKTYARYMLAAKGELKVGARVRVVAAGVLHQREGVLERITALDGLWPYEVRFSDQPGLSPFDAHELEVI
ncbi:helix-turn-helix domain-containing protein [Paraburkholderia susongensis]|uniref:Helix-turn-helix domain-containing protein n=1 Tax=Paraburkholderia susongensis TaxID=1515439 RepID=A0A1X7KQ45_9BURK|nr:helix-turn-helix domain-containing protein [Paraburkholderia susongensis]SMG43513.1 Helix-turn-helix domain-containing protein [Paraburkholderia susongensis]